MNHFRKFVIAGAAGTAIALGFGGVAIANGGADKGDDGDASVTGSQADHATRAALNITGGGHTNSVERDSENGATWEVEVTMPNGHTVDVRLDKTYHLVVIEGDSGH